MKKSLGSWGGTRVSTAFLHVALDGGESELFELGADGGLHDLDEESVVDRLVCDDGDVALEGIAGLHGVALEGFGLASESGLEGLDDESGLAALLEGRAHLSALDFEDALADHEDAFLVDGDDEADRIPKQILKEINCIAMCTVAADGSIESYDF